MVEEPKKSIETEIRERFGVLIPKEHDQSFYKTPTAKTGGRKLTRNEHIWWQVIKAGKLRIVKYLIEQNVSMENEQDKEWKNISIGWLTVAAQFGKLNIIKYFHTKMIGTSNNHNIHAISKAASGGHLDVIKWLTEYRSDGCDTTAMDAAAFNNHLDVIIWLHENRTEGCTTEAMDCAADRGHLGVLKWLNENRKEGCTQGALDGAVSHNHADVVQYLLEAMNQKFGYRMIIIARERNPTILLHLKNNLHRWDKPLDNYCSDCFRSNEPPLNMAGPVEKLMACTRCRLVKYCSADCQRKDWKTHRYVCNK
jgi:hypothetical protein